MWDFILLVPLAQLKARLYAASASSSWSVLVRISPLVCHACQLVGSNLITRSTSVMARSSLGGRMSMYSAARLRKLSRCVSNAQKHQECSFHFNSFPCYPTNKLISRGLVWD